MSANSLQNLLNRTRRLFTAPSATLDREASAPPAVEAIDTPALMTDPRVVDLAHLLNVTPEAITIQHRSRRDGSSCVCFETTLGPADRSITLAFTEDLLKAYIIRIADPAATAPERIAALLRDRGLDVDPSTIEKGLTTIDFPRRPLKIAQGTPPVPGEDEKIRYTFYPSVEARETASPFFDRITAAPLQELPAETRAIWVAPGQVLAELEPATPGTEGADLFGHPLPAIDGLSLGLSSGPGVQLDDDGRTYRAIAHGYVYLHGELLGVRDPFTVNRDGLSALFTVIPGWTFSPPTAEDLQRSMDDFGIQRGLDAEQCQQAVRAFVEVQDSPATFCLALGAPPEDGRDGEIIFDVDCQPKPGRINPDGSIDFRETSFGLNVPAGILLARLRPATEGRDGFTIFGDDLPARSGVPRQLVAGAHVEATQEEELLFRATKDGRVSYQNGILQVHETLQIPADVDYQTGNIDFSGDVSISGSVLPGFTVKARGSIAVQGQIEAGARLEAGGEILIGGGIVGSDTRLSATGSITAKFIQDAAIYTGGDLTVGSYIFGARVRSAGTVTVNQSDSRKSGTISGGQIVAARGLRASFAGSPSGTATHLVVGVDPGIEESLRQCQHKLHLCEQERERLRNLLGLEEVTLPRLKRLLSRTPLKRRDQIVEFIRQWQKLDKVTRSMRARRSSLRHDLTQPAPEALLAVDQVIYPGVRLQFGEHTAEIQLELRDTELTSDTWTERMLIQSAA